MSVTYLAADLGPAEVALEKQAKALKRAGNAHAAQLASLAAHQCRMLDRQLAYLKAAAESGKE